MTLEFGVNDYSEYIHVSEIKRGKSDLHCPYCGGLLIARKGDVLAHHFAHAGETCLQSESANSSLPVYDNFNLHLPSHVVAELRNWAAGGELRWRANTDILVNYGLLEYRDFRDGRHSLTHKGKLVLGELSLMLFSDFQEPLIRAQYDKLEAQVQDAWADRPYALPRARLRGEIETLKNQLYNYKNWQEYDYKTRAQAQAPLREKIEKLEAELRAIPRTEAKYDLETALADLRLYKLKWKRILDTTLYFLEITHSGGVLHKIGVTARADVSGRAAEVQRDLTALIGECSITVLGTWPHRGNVEHYFKYRYQAHNAKIGKLTEYFQFDDVKSVLRDLRRMKDKEFTDLESEIVRGNNSTVEETIRLHDVEVKRRAAVRAGMAKAAAKGKHVGRPQGAETVERFLTKPEIVVARRMLEEKISLRKISQQTNLAINTIRKLQSTLKNKQSE